MRTLVYQSFRSHDIPEWISTCLKSAKAWAALRGWDYQLIGDEIFDLIPNWYREKTEGRIPIQTDLGRLILARDFLARDYDRVIWLDADMLVFDPENFQVSVEEQYAFGREIWVQKDSKGRLKAYKNVHNAFSLYLRGNDILDFYIHAAKTIIAKHQGGLAPQIVGPKLLTSLNNTVGFPLVDEAGMISPLVMYDLVHGGGQALELHIKTSPKPIRAANLSSSMAGRNCDDIEVTEKLFEQVCNQLLVRKTLGPVG